MRILLFTCLLSLLLPGSGARAQATRVVADTGDYLLQITQRWGRESPLGALAARPMEAGDMEVRLWEGYGLGGQWGVVLRRDGGRWQAWHARIVRCTFSLPVRVRDTLSLPSVLRYRQLARARCAETNAGQAELPPGTRSWTEIADDTVALAPVERNAPLESLWADVLRAGVATLPPRVPRSWVMTDGHTYVVELRRGDEYRASVIERTTPPETAADTAVQAVAAVLHRLSRPKW